MTRISSVPSLRAEAEALLPALHRKATQPAGPDGVRSVIGKRLALYPPADMAEGAQAAWWEDYIGALGDLPVSALEAGMSAWIKRPDSRFMPKPGELRRLALTEENKAVRAYERARASVEHTPPEEASRSGPAEAVRSAPTDEDRSRVKAWAADFARQVEAKKPVMEPLPTAHGKADETGLTPAMRKLMQDRGSQR